MSSSSLNFQSITPPPRLPAPLEDVTSAGTSFAATRLPAFTPRSLVVSKLSYVVPPATVLYDDGTFSPAEAARYASNVAALAASPVTDAALAYMIPVAQTISLP